MINKNITISDLIALDAYYEKHFIISGRMWDQLNEIERNDANEIGIKQGIILVTIDRFFEENIENNEIFNRD